MIIAPKRRVPELVRTPATTFRHVHRNRYTCLLLIAKAISAERVKMMVFRNDGEIRVLAATKTPTKTIHAVIGAILDSLCPLSESTGIREFVASIASGNDL